MNGGMDSTRFQSYAAPSSVSTPSTGPNKRTPSTTHPYQMSEAFANRHHHCERVDSLNRGIWTSYGIGGTKDNPTGPAVEMYLRCNHDGCSRIDWRTVHGLQCHIVKNHLQPKGTIGSLDRALEKYGVPVKEVEDYERIHGRGSAGTMADPKNHKIKIKTLEASESPGPSGDRAPGSYVIDPETRPAGYRPSPTSTVESPPASSEAQRSPKISTQMSPPKEPTPADDATKWSAAAVTSAAPASSWSATSWLSSYMSPRKFEPEPKSLQGDFGMSETQSKADQAPAQPVVPTGQPQALQPPPEKVEAPRPESSGISSGAPAASADKSPPPTTDLPPIPSATVPSAESGVKDVEVATNDAKPQADGPTSAPTQNVGRPQIKDEDIQMTGTGEQNGTRDSENNVNGQPGNEETGEGIDGGQEKAEPERSPRGEDSSDHSETIVVDGDERKDPAVKKKPPPSPSLTTKTVPAPTPTSAKRPSRRSSVARRSVDGDGDAGYAKDTTTSINNNTEEGKGDREVKEEKVEPRRSINGRLLRRGRV